MKRKGFTLVGWVVVVLIFVGGIALISRRIVGEVDDFKADKEIKISNPTNILYVYVEQPGGKYQLLTVIKNETIHYSGSDKHFMYWGGEGTPNEHVIFIPDSRIVFVTFDKLPDELIANPDITLPAEEEVDSIRDEW